MSGATGRRPTVYDVAARVGVSIATVSFAFTQPERVRKTTLDAVLAAANALGYVPSACARGLAKGRTGAIGLRSFDYMLDAPADTDHGRLLVRADARLGAGEAVVLAARPEAVTLTDRAPTHATPNELTGSVVTHSFLGDSVDHIVRVGDLEVRARCNAATSLPPATTVTLRIDPASLTLIPIGD